MISICCVGFASLDVVCDELNDGGEVMYFGCVCFWGELGFLNSYDICMCVVNKQFKHLEFVFDSVYVDLQYDEISLTFTAGSVPLS